MRVSSLLFVVLAVFCFMGAVTAQSCDADGLSGNCVNTDTTGCSGQLIPGYCPGGSNIVCCVSMPGCSTPQGSGTCSLTSACSGTSVPGYCPGPDDVECCVGGGGQACSTPRGSGTCELTSQCSGTPVPGYCPGPSDVQCCVTGGGGCNVSAVVQFADAQWDCADISCSSTVPAGSSQPYYACAEFAARALAYGGCIPIDPYASQSDYSNFEYGDLIVTTGLGAALDKLGFTRMGSDGSSVNAGCAVVGNGGDGDWSHAAIGVASATVDAHNNARYHMGATWVMVDGIDEIWCP